MAIVHNAHHCTAQILVQAAELHSLSQGKTRPGAGMKGMVTRLQTCVEAVEIGVRETARVGTEDATHRMKKSAHLGGWMIRTQTGEEDGEGDHTVTIGNHEGEARERGGG